MAMNLPLPKILSDIEPGGGIYTTYNALTQNALANRKQELANQYYGPKSNAEIQQMLAHTGLLGSETQKNQFQLNHPAYMNPEGFLYDMAAKQQGMGNQPTNSYANNLNQTVLPSQNDNQYTPTNDQPYAPGSKENEIIGGQGSTVTNALQNPNPSMPQSPGANSFGLASLIKQKLDPQGYAANLQQQQANIDLYNKSLTESADESQGASGLVNNIKQMKTAFPSVSTFEKGQSFGHVPPFSAGAQNFDVAKNQYDKNLIKAFQDGRVTDKDIQFVQSGNLSRAMKDKSFYQNADNFNLLAKRANEKNQFLLAAQRQNIPFQVAQGLYAKYINERPVFDYEKVKPLSENLNTWNDYLTPQAYQALVSGKPFSPNISAKENTKTEQNPIVNNKNSWPQAKEALNENELQGKTPGENSIWMIRPDGKKVPVHNENINVAMSKYNFRKAD
jgi:hypothetical protein